MKTTMTAAALGIALCLPATAMADATSEELAVLRAQVSALLERVDQLERARAAAPASGAAPATGTVPAVEERLAAVEETNDRQSDQLAQGLAATGAMDWARSLRWKGDVRYRHEQFDVEGASSDRVRHRIRARLGLDARIGPTLSAGFQIATGEISDPRSSNATLDDANRRKEFALDLAYVDWRPRPDLLVTLGKQKQPWFRAGNSLFFDGDVNPEGVSIQYGGRSGVFARGWGYWLEEMSGAADSNLVGAQLGYAFENGLTLAAGYWDYGAIEGQPILNFSGAPAGNSTYNADGACNALPAGTTRCYVHDYNVAVADLQWQRTLAGRPLVLFGGYLENLDPDALNTGYNLGFLYGRASDAGSWEFGALYQDVERDAQFAGLLDSDFADGLTQGKGVQLQGAWAPARNVTVKAALFLNDRSYDTATEAEYRRLQLDLNYRF